MIGAKVLLVVYVMLGNEPPHDAQGFRFKGEEDCIKAKSDLMQHNQNIKAFCVSEMNWQQLGGK